MFGSFPFASTLVAAAVGVGDGAISATDAKAGRGTFSKQYSTRFQFAVLLGGVGLGLLTKMGPDVTEPLIETPVALLARRAAFVQVVKGSTTAVGSYGLVAAPRFAVNGAAPRFAAHPNRVGASAAALAF